MSEAGAVAARAEDLKIRKYEHLDSAFLFFPVAVETCGAFGPKAREFLRDLGRRIRKATSEDGAYWQLIQRISVAIQRGNVTSIVGSVH